MNIIKYAGYEGTAELDLDSFVCRGKILFIDDLVTYQADSPKDIEAAFKEAVDDYVATCEELGREPQKPLSGTFNVRISPELHKAARVRAAADETSLNEMVAAAIQCYVIGAEHVVNNHTHSHQYISVSSSEQMFDLYSASVETKQAFTKVIAGVH